MDEPLQAEQQLGFPAGATAGASSLDTAAPTVSLPHFSHFPYLFAHCCVLPVVASFPISRLTATPTSHVPFSTSSGSHLTLQHNCLIFSLCRCRAFQTQRPRQRRERAAMTRMDRMAGRRRTGTPPSFSIVLNSHQTWHMTPVSHLVHLLVTVITFYHL